MDWDQLLKETIRHFQDYIRINTANPPGNEVQGARFFKRILEAESIPCQIFEPSPGRGNLLATLRGNGAKKPTIIKKSEAMSSARSAQMSAFLKKMTGAFAGIKRIKTENSIHWRMAIHAQFMLIQLRKSHCSIFCRKQLPFPLQLPDATFAA